LRKAEGRNEAETLFQASKDGVLAVERVFTRVEVEYGVVHAIERASRLAIESHPQSNSLLARLPISVSHRDLVEVVEHRADDRVHWLHLSHARTIGVTR